YRASGVALGGALDRIALVTANRMAGNSDDAAAIECTLGALRVRFDAPTRVALAGAECDAMLDGVRLAAWSCAPVAAGSELMLGRPRAGARTIVAVGGGIDVPVVLGSRSTDLGAGFGGFDGRALRAGDCVPFGEPSSSRGAFRLQPPQWALRAPEDDAGVVSVRALAGTEAPAFGEALWATPWTIAPQSNRMGYRLHGTPLAVPDGAGTLASHAVMPGLVQVPPDGQPIVLLADAQTTGGYPRAAVVIEADLWRLAQASAGTRVRFARVTLDQARAARADVEAYLAATGRTIAEHVQ
ncbi:MAG: biotin-dependent carboxyltransferase, partial [bacterium]|nr:biotin-dependent carboxyltransferase [bacterium]